MQTTKILRIGHRGAMGHITENTISSIKKALELNCDMIEIDVYRIKSGELMVFHDHTLDRLTDKKGNIEDYSFKELRDIKINNNHLIPTLQEVIETIQRKAILNIELKGSNTAIGSYKIIEKYIEKGWTKEDFVISSFRWDELEIISQQKTSIPIAVLIGQEPINSILPFALKLNAAAINPYYKLLTIDNVKAIKDLGLKIYPWTVNNTSDIQLLKELKVDGIITNFPEKV
ncbi:glycerophosphodiester phosphodiesterase [Myroides guanonis]|uniref:Glycerophosphoryl diester phosphodiesterase n=1 Tax=Myroides guanonis TaxID=1150112 RepID=A0A1I3NVX9_9FLAO|nr:glycerophosphodiester phosphodiesterase [Myroides guanonis]SFJ12926.1 glycerophosphoryl diester phosphodiesterase [Myroides guanonis]